VSQLEAHFNSLVDSHSWSTVTVDRNGLQFFWKYVLKREWDWISIVKAPKVKCPPDILTRDEVRQLIAATDRLRYRVFVLTTVLHTHARNLDFHPQCHVIVPGGAVHTARGQ